jgi:hypothetical protein
MVQDIKRKAYKQALSEVRKNYIAEIENSIKSLMVIRDTSPSTRDRNDACKSILKFFNALQPDKEPTKAEDKAGETQAEVAPPMTLPVEEEERIRKMINGSNGT